MAATIDAHIHQWDPLTTPRVTSGAAKILRRTPWIRPVLMRVLPRAARDFAGDPVYLLNPYLPTDYVADGGPANVGTVVHVEAGWQAKAPLGSVDETRWVSTLPFGENGAPVLGAIVVHTDPSEPGVADVLDAHLHASPLVRGVRCVAAYSPVRGIQNFAKRPSILSEPAFLSGFSAVADRKLNFEIWVYGHQLPDAITLASEYPETTFVLDHYATPVGAVGSAGSHDVLQRWRDDISMLAALPNVVAKHSGLGMPVLGLGPLPRERLRDAIAPLITHLDQAFGPERTFWSSNYPMDKPNVSLPDSIWILRDVLGDRFHDDRMLRDNAKRVYRI